MTPGELRDGMAIFYGGLRSGTKMPRLRLDGHPDIACPGERGFMVGFLREGRDGLVLDAEALQEARLFRNSRLSVPEARERTAAFWSFVRVFAMALLVRIFRFSEDDISCFDGLLFVGRGYRLGSKAEPLHIDECGSDA